MGANLLVKKSQAMDMQHRYHGSKLVLFAWSKETCGGTSFESLLAQPGVCVFAFITVGMVLEVEHVLGFSGVVCFPLVCTPLHLASACVWQTHHCLCGFVIVIRSLVLMA